MSLKIEILSEDELGAFARVAQSAFVEGIGSVLLCGGAAANPTSYAKLVQSEQKSYRNDPTARFVKAVDISTGTIVAVAKWNFYLRERTPEELDAAYKPKPGDEGYVAAYTPILDYLYDNRKHYKGTKPYIYLNLLCTDPDFHRRGAGGKLLEWGVKQADELGLEMVLEASRDGHALYERWGFKVVKETRFDMAQFERPDLTGEDLNRVMTRLPSSKP